MPYSDRARYEHEEVGSRKGVVRIRTVRAGDDELRIGYDRANRGHVVTILRPKAAKKKRRSRARARTGHAHPHSRGDHPGPCSRACRRGMVTHRHRR